MTSIMTSNTTLQHSSRPIILVLFVLVILSTASPPRRNINNLPRPSRFSRNESSIRVPECYIIHISPSTSCSNFLKTPSFGRRRRRISNIFNEISICDLKYKKVWRASWISLYCLYRRRCYCRWIFIFAFLDFRSNQSRDSATWQ